jgi:hypothetical protein
MTSAFSLPPGRQLPRRLSRRGRLAAACGVALAGLGMVTAVVVIGPGRLLAQIEGDRGIAPVVNTGDLEVDGIEVDVVGKSAQEARNAGYREAYKQAWAQLKGPEMDAGSIESMVSGVVVERESLGPHRYIARLGVVFDRGRAGQYVGAAAGSPIVVRSEPLLTVPVLYSGGVAQTYEVRGTWQRAWAEFHTGGSAIDYVRPSGSGGDSLVLTAGQEGRRSRVWWRGLFDQYNTSNVLFPVARLDRQWPGGPVKGTFTARYGPDNVLLDSFTLTAADESAVPRMLADAVHRMDQLFTDALARGLLRGDATLAIEHAQVDPALQALIDAGKRQQALDDAQAAAEGLAPSIEAAPVAALDEPGKAPEKAPEKSGEKASEKPGEKAAEKPEKAAKAEKASFTIQFASPDARAVDLAVAGVRGTPGVSGAATVSLAIGGTSVLRASYAGSAEDLAKALRARGFTVSVSGGVLRIRR